MTVVDTQISWGYQPLIEIFGKANSLVLKLEPYYTEIEESTAISPVKDSKLVIGRQYIRISYEEGSDTAIAITCLSIKHLGFENMLCDYLIRCNVEPKLIPIGQYVMRKTPEQMENEWQEHRKKIGLR